MSSLLDLVCSTIWAVRPEALQAIVGLVQREDISRHVVAAAFHSSEARQREAARAYETRIPLQAVGAYQADPVRDTFNLYRRGSTAVLPITGPITRYSNLFQIMSGNGTSVETLAKDFTAALDDPSFSSILLSVDSPGGEANGINELAQMIVAARGIKPVWAYVSDLGASAAYWLASAAEQVIAAETAALGSIGAIAVFRDAMKPSKDIAFVSSVSPRKAMDPTTKSGAEDIQELVDAYGRIFVEAVAKNRGISTEAVVENYGQGGVLLGRAAVDAGMADDLGTFEGALVSLGELTRPATPAAVPRRAAEALVDRVTALEPVASVIATTLSSHVNLSHSLANVVETTFAGGKTNLEAVQLVQGETLQGPVDHGELDQPEGDPSPATPVAEADMSDQPTTPPTPSVDYAQAELAALRAENQRLRLSAHKANANAFADARIAEMRAFPAEREHLAALYVQAALDDENLGPGVDGNLRVQTLANAVAARTSVSHLTAEALVPTTMQALHAKASAAPSDTMTEEKKTTLLGYTPLGKVLANGQGSK